MLKSRYHAAFLFTAISLIHLPAVADESHEAAVIINIDDAPWRTVNDAGVEVAVLSGDPSQPGVYSLMMRVPQGVKTPVHTHGDAWRHSLVVSGTLYFAFGDSWDPETMTAIGPGGFFTEGPADAHYAWAKDGPVVAFLTAMGPTTTDVIAPPPQ